MNITIANIFLSEGKTNERGNYLSASAIRKIIRNPLYCGIAVMNRSHFDFDRKILMKNPEQDWISHKHAVPAIVDEKTIIGSGAIVGGLVNSKRKITVLGRNITVADGATIATTVTDGAAVFDLAPYSFAYFEVTGV